MGANVVSSVVQLGDRPHLDRLVGPVKVLIDEYIAGSVDEVHIFYTTFINTMRQEPRHGRIIPIPEQFRTPAGEVRKAEIWPTARGTTSTSRTRGRCSTA